MSTPSLCACRSSARLLLHAFLLGAALCAAAGGAAAQTVIGRVRLVEAGGLVTIQLDSAHRARPGVLAHVLYFDQETQSWLPKAELALQAVDGAGAEARILSQMEGATLEAGDPVARFEAVVQSDVALRVAPAQLELLRGETATLVAELVDRGGAIVQRLPARWQSSDPAVAEVAPSGTVVALAPGRATITASTSAGLVAAAPVSVAEAVVQGPDSVVLFVGTRDTLELHYLLPDGTRRPLRQPGVRWSSGSPEVAEVDSILGVLLPHQPGLTQVSATGTGRPLSIPVQVHPRPTRVTFTPGDTLLELARGDSIAVLASAALPDGSTIARLPVALASSSPRQLSPAGEGWLRAVREGTVRLQASAAGIRQEWAVQIYTPRICVRTPRALLLIGEPVSLAVEHCRKDGTPLDSATDAQLTSLTPEVLQVSGRTIRPVGPGRGVVLVSEDAAADTLTFHVLGDLLVTLETPAGPTLATVSTRMQAIHPLAGGKLRGWSPSLSPDGQTLAFVSTQGGRSPRIHLATIDGENLRRLTPEGSGGPFRLGLHQEHSPRWSADGRRVFFISDRAGNYEVYSVGADGADLVRVSRSREAEVAVAVAPDHARIALERTRGTHDSDVLLARPDGEEAIPVSLGAGVAESAPQFVAGSRKLLLAVRRRDDPGETGSFLAEVDVDALSGLASGQSPDYRVLVHLARRQPARFAVSPDAQRFIYVTDDGSRRGGDRIVVSSLVDGTSLFSFDPGSRIRDVTWTFTPLNSQESLP